MAIFRQSRRTRDSDLRPEPSPLDDLRSAVLLLDRAKRARDSAIGRAKAHRVPLRDVAEAAGLSVSRIKQLDTGEVGRDDAHLPPVTEVDLRLAGASSDRVLALEEVDFGFKRWDSERECIAADPKRFHSLRYDIGHSFYDLSPVEPWTVVYVEATHEVYAFRHVPPQPEWPGSAYDEERTEGATGLMSDGSPSGPCVLLGYLPSYGIVEAALDTQAMVVMHRLGGLAWLLGRIRLVNQILDAVADPITGIFEKPEDIWNYLRSIQPEQGT